jgi:uncharacterized protein YgiM (DUF1202 family)
LLAIFLCGACASKPAPKPEFSYVTPLVTYLRECPRLDCREVAEVHKSDQVEVLENKEGGWHLVKLLSSNQQGWIQGELLGQVPPAQLSERPAKVQTEVAPGKSVHYVAAPEAKLTNLPLISSQVIKILKLNDKMEIISHSGPKWSKVREWGGGAEGWIQARYLKDAPVAKEPQVIRRKTAKKAGHVAPKEELPSQPEDVGPSAM